MAARFITTLRIKCYINARSEILALTTQGYFNNTNNMRPLPIVSYVSLLVCWSVPALVAVSYSSLPDQYATCVDLL